MSLRLYLHLFISASLGAWLSLSAFTPTEDGIYATFETNMGQFTAVLYYEQTPMTVANFIGLAEGSRNWIDPRNAEVSNRPYYNGITFHRVIANFMIQGGSPSGLGTDGPGYNFPDEFVEGLIHDSAGLLSMANSGPSTNGSQFFITVAPTPWLDNKHTVFGRIVDGYDQVEAISKVATDNNARPANNVRIDRLIITRHGSAASAFDIHQQSLPSIEPLSPQIRHVDDQLIAIIPMPPNSQSFAYQTKNFIQWNRINTPIYNMVQPEENFPLLSASASEKSIFYRFARLNYPFQIFSPVDLIGRKMILNIPYEGGVHVLRLEFTTENAGTGTFNDGDVVDLVYQFVQGPYRSQLVFSLTGLVPISPSLHFKSATSGTFRGVAGQGQDEFPISGTFQLE